MPKNKYESLHKKYEAIRLELENHPILTLSPEELEEADIDLPEHLEDCSYIELKAKLIVELAEAKLILELINQRTLNGQS